MVMLYRFPPRDVRKLMEIHGLSKEEVVQELTNGTLTLPERLPLSPEEEQQEFEDELLEALTTPLTESDRPYLL